MDRNRLIVAIALSLVVLTAWPLAMRYFAPPAPIEEQLQVGDQVVQPAAISQPQAANLAPKTGIRTGTGPSASAAKPQTQTQTTQAAPRDITISSDAYSVKLSNRGGVASSWILIKYKEGGLERNLTGADGNELQLIPQQIPAGVDSPLSLRTPWAPEVGSQLNGVNFDIEGVAADETEVKLTATGKRRITFKYSSPTITATKSFTFHADTFVVDVTADVQSSSGVQQAELVLGPRFGDQSDTQTGSYSTPPQAVAYTRDGHRQQILPAKITPPFATITSVDHGSNQIEIDKPLPEGVTQIKIVGDKGATFHGYARVLSREPNAQRLTLDAVPAGATKGAGIAQAADTLRNLYGWAGVTDHYFAMLAVPQQSIAEITLTNIQVKRDHDQAPMDYPSASIPVASTTHLFVGPKDRELLAAVGQELNANLGALIDYGIFSFAVKPVVPVLAAALNRLRSLFGNYGWAIVGVTVLINLALSPLRFYSSKKMKKAAKHQPRMKELQERMKKLKENPKKHERELQELQQEQLALMKEANPLGGCMPLLLQMPIFWAVYLYLGSSLDVRHAPWILWLQDLSRPDPYKILPIVMCVTMIASTKLTPQPATADPSMKMQRVMMTWLMPIMLTWLFFFSAPSGLVLYWMVSNMVGVLIQLWINHKTADLTAEIAAAAAASAGGKGNARTQDKQGAQKTPRAKGSGKKRTTEAEGF